MKIKIITLCLLISVFFSCKKDDLAKVGNSGNSYVPMLSKILTDNISSKEYLYNDSNLVRQEKGKFDLTIHHYNGKGQLASSEFYGNDDILSSDVSVSENAMNQAVWVTPESGKKNGTITYEYNANGQLIKTTSVRPALSCTEYSVFSYDANNRINKQTMYFENVSTGYIDYTYDAKGNLTGEMLYNLAVSGAAELITASKFTFDSQPNPLKASSKLLIPGINTNANNIVKETYTIHLDAADGPDKVQVTENSYKYNGLGYPISNNGNITYVYE